MAKTIENRLCELASELLHVVADIKANGDALNSAYEQGYEAGKAERQTGQWIPCSERLPEHERRCYWVCTDTQYQYECRWTNNIYGLRESDDWGWSIFDTPQYTKVVAWMPLPEPYQKEVEHE